MNVDVDQLGVDVDEQECYGEFSLHQGGVIAFEERVVDPLAFDGTLIDEEMLLTAIGAADAGFADEARDADIAVGQLDGEEFLDELRAVQFPEATGQIVGRREIEDFAAIDGELERDVGMRERAERDDVLDVRGLGRDRAQEFAAGGQIEEQVAHFHDGSFRRAHVGDGQDLSAGHFDLRPAQRAPFAAGEREPRDGGDARDGFAAKPERRDAVQVFGPGNFAGGMTFEGEERVVAAHAEPVVGDIDERATAVLDGDRDASGFGVEGVLDQLLHDGGGPLDHLAGSDLVGDLLGEETNPVHGRIIADGGAGESGKTGRR